MTPSQATETTPYDDAFHLGHADGSFRSAQVIVPLVMDLVNPESVVDIGCGLGTWLAAFSEAGVTDFLGLDGEYVPKEKLQIPAGRFRAANLSTTPDLGRRFDLAVCLEVAEHLPVAMSPKLVEMLTKAAPIILFSAAVPGQGGTNHINEQWPSFWESLFAARGCVRLDPIRPRVWRDDRVRWWYRQNVYLYVHESVLSTRAVLRDEYELSKTCRFELLHEKVARKLWERRPTLREIVFGFPGALVRRIRKLF